MQSHEVDQLQRALTLSATEMTGPGPNGREPSLDERLQQLTRAAVDNVPGANHVVLTMRQNSGELVSWAPTSRDVAQLDRLQVKHHEGPCVEAAEDPATRVIEVADLKLAGERWPHFAPAAAERGVGSLLAYAMAPAGASPGAVNFYSSEADGFDQLSKAIAGAFAVQAGIAVYGAKRIADLERAVASRDVIGQAKGILMERHSTDSERAFRMLVRASQDTNIKLVDVANWLVEDVGTSSNEVEAAPGQQ